MQWCDECGLEHEDWATACAHCGGELRPEPPEPEPEPDHGTVDLDVSGLSGAQLNHLDLLLTAAGIPWFTGRGTRTVPSSRADEVLELAELASEPDGSVVPVEAPDPADRSPRERLADATAQLRGDLPGPPTVGVESDGSTVRLEVAGTWMRVWADVVNYYLLGCSISIVVAPLRAIWGPIGGSAQVLLYIGLGIGLIAKWGVDLGKLLCRVQVVDHDGLPPGLARSLRRGLVVWGPALLFALVEWFVISIGQVPDDGSSAPISLWIGAILVGLVWPVALIGSIATDPLRRGWHDRLAGTWVIRTSEVARLDVLRMAGRREVVEPSP